MIFGPKLIQDLLHHAISPLLATPEEVHEKMFDGSIAVTLHSGGRASIESLFDLRRAELPIGFWGENF